LPGSSRVGPRILGDRPLTSCFRSEVVNRSLLSRRSCRCVGACFASQQFEEPAGSVAKAGQLGRLDDGHGAPWGPWADLVLVFWLSNTSPGCRALSEEPRDVTFGEDRSQVRTGTLPRVLTTLSNLAIGIIRHTAYRSVKITV